MSSNKQDGPGKDASVFDFVYVDFQRVSSLLSQLNDMGNLSEISENKSAGRSSDKADSQELGGSIAVASGRAQFGTTIGARHERSIQRTYDPRWMNAINFLDEADERDLINRNIGSARIGEIVMISGPLRIRDFGSLREIWRKPSMEKSMRLGAPKQTGGNRQARRKTAASGALPKNPQPTDLDIFLDLVEVLPHTVQSFVGQPESVAWGILRDEGIIGSASDFVLKFGGAVPGEWTAIGILEAFPGESANPEDIVQTTALDQVGDALLMHLEPLTRQLLGRPSDAYGITPLVILREVG